MCFKSENVRDIGGMGMWWIILSTTLFAAISGGCWSEGSLTSFKKDAKVFKVLGVVFAFIVGFLLRQLWVMTH